jgi:hypothetical protein
MLTNESITFGKYKGKTLGHVLKDRGYCAWLKDQDWFQESYEYLYNRICEYDPRSYFLSSEQKEYKHFLSDYEFFNLRPLTEISLPLTTAEQDCYKYYIEMIYDLRDQVYRRLENDEENPYDIKAPTKWLQRFERKCGIPRIEFKEFLSSYDLINIPYIVKRIKEEGGLDYKGADSFLIAKARSVDQEKWWEDILKDKYGESLTVQYTYKNCIFDFLNIDTHTIFECKLGLKDFCAEQHRKYKLALEKYRIIYLIAKDCVVDMEQKKIFTTNIEKYDNYLISIPSLKKPSYLDIFMLEEEFSVVELEDVSRLFGCNPEN